MSDLAKSLAGKNDEEAPNTRLASLLAALERYGDGSLASLEKMRGDVQEMVRSAPPDVDRYAGMAARYMPGIGALESVRYGADAARNFHEGNYASAVGDFGRAVDAPFNEVFWFVPGGGAAKKVAR